MSFYGNISKFLNRWAWIILELVVEFCRFETCAQCSFQLFVFLGSADPESVERLTTSSGVVYTVCIKSRRWLFGWQFTDCADSVLANCYY